MASGIDYISGQQIVGLIFGIIPEITCFIVWIFYYFFLHKEAVRGRFTSNWIRFKRKKGVSSLFIRGDELDTKCNY